MSNAYFHLPAACKITDHQAVLPIKNGLMFLYDLTNSHPIYTFHDGSAIHHALLSEGDDLRFWQAAQGQSASEMRERMGIDTLYLGDKIEDVFKAFPGLAGTKEVELIDEETGEPEIVEIPIIAKHIWG